MPTRKIARDGLLAAALLASTAAQAVPDPKTAAPVHHAHGRRHHHLASRIAPLPPAASAAPVGNGTSPAPVPNEAMSAPIDNTDKTASVAPSVFSLHYPPQGDGYVTGSSPQAMDDRNAAKATGVQAKVPLPQ